METRQILIVGDRPLQAYFRFPLFRAAEGGPSRFQYLYLKGRHAWLEQLADGKVLRRPWKILQSSSWPTRPDLLIFSLGLSNPMRGLLLKSLLRPRRTAWDYIDDLYYQNEGPRQQFYHQWWTRLCDEVFLLNPLLAFRFPRSFCWSNASHLRPMARLGTAVGTIASLDERFDRQIYEEALRQFPETSFQLYGWVKSSRSPIHDWLERMKDFPNFRYAGPYRPDDLQEILAGFRIGWIPYRAEASTFYIHPDKYYHFRNAGLPVLSSWIPVLQGSPGIHFYADRRQGLETMASLLTTYRPGVTVDGGGTTFRWDERLRELQEHLMEQDG